MRTTSGWESSWPDVEGDSSVLSNSSFLVVARSRSSKSALGLHTQRIVGPNPTPPISARILSHER